MIYGSRQLVIELKNVREVEREHINQLNRYLATANALKIKVENLR